MDIATLHINVAPTAPKPDGYPRVPSIPATGWGQPLRSRQRTLLPPVPPRAPDRTALPKGLLRLPHGSAASTR